MLFSTTHLHFVLALSKLLTGKFCDHSRKYVDVKCSNRHCWVWMLCLCGTQAISNEALIIRFKGRALVYPFRQWWTVTASFKKTYAGTSKINCTWYRTVSLLWLQHKAGRYDVEWNQFSNVEGHSNKNFLLTFKFWNIIRSMQCGYSTHRCTNKTL